MSTASTAGRDPVIGTAESVAREWADEASRRRAISASDPIADTLAYCAGELVTRLHAITVAEREGLSAEQYAAMYEVTPQTVRQWCRRSLVPARLTGRGWIIRAGAPRPGRAGQSERRTA